MAVTHEDLTPNRYELRNRYLFEGSLKMETAFHIGGGRATLSSSDSPVILTPEELPFIPGSSFKGSLRSSVEKLVPGLPTKKGIYSCALINLDAEELAEERRKPGPICPTVRQDEITKRRRDDRSEKALKDLQIEIQRDLCHTCRLFGSPFGAARIAINDLYMPAGSWKSIIERRDGVVIDRDSETAKDRLKYDFEVVPASTTFDLKITLENATEEDLQLISIGLSEFVNGSGIIGGKRSSGLGACILEHLKVSALELKGKDYQTGREVSEKERNERLKNYLLCRHFSSVINGNEFLSKHIENIFQA